MFYLAQFLKLVCLVLEIEGPSLHVSAIIANKGIGSVIALFSCWEIYLMQQTLFLLVHAMGQMYP